MKSPLLVLATLAVTGLLSAHECWLQPATFAPVAGPTIGLTIQVGMNFQGEPKPFNPERIAALKHFSAAGTEDWTAKANNKLQLPVKFEHAGTHVITYDSKPSLITLKPAEFDEYLREEGLEFVIAEREKAGESAKPGRERYQRCNKTIVQADGKPDAAYSIVTGQRLEIIPINDPAAWQPGGLLRFKLLFSGQPLAAAKVRAWHRAGDKLTTLDATSTTEGEVTFALPAGGQWMLSTIHMVRLTGDAAADWESHWGNLTLAVRRQARP
jgi:uncharacterized GH25 family protein